MTMTDYEVKVAFQIIHRLKEFYPDATISIERKICSNQVENGFEVFSTYWFKLEGVYSGSFYSMDGIIAKVNEILCKHDKEYEKSCLLKNRRWSELFNGQN